MAEPLTPFEQQAMEAKTKVRAEMPEMADVPIEPMGWVDSLIAAAKKKLLGADVAALAHSDNVSYNPPVVQQMSPASMGDTFAHELKHVQQGREDYAGKGLVGKVGQFIQDRRESRLPYGQQPHELEAYQFEADRATREGRPGDPHPKFLTPGMSDAGSINLPEPDLKLMPGDHPSILAENVRKLVGMGYSQEDATKRAIREARKSKPGEIPSGSVAAAVAGLKPGETIQQREERIRQYMRTHPLYDDKLEK